MITLWTIAGFIIGWVLIEIVAAFTHNEMPILLNLGMGFVGALTAYSILN